MPFHYAPVRALRAARKIAADPDDLPQVFTIIDALSGDTVERIGQRIEASPLGRRLMIRRPDIVSRLEDREALRRLPEGSFGRAYLDFVERESISAEGIRAAGEKGIPNQRPLPEHLEWIRGRMRDTHDLWHVAAGYSGDVLGETALLGFIFAQTKNPGIALVLAIGLAKTVSSPLGGAAARKTIIDGYRRGRRSAYLPEQIWEDMLALPLAEVRRRLGLETPPVYTEIRSSALKSVARAA